VKIGSKLLEQLRAQAVHSPSRAGNIEGAIGGVLALYFPPSPCNFNLHRNNPVYVYYLICLNDYLVH
jgi:hypothetical protein